MCCKLNWPSGTYGLPKSSSGCADNDKFVWGSGYSKEEGEGDSSGSNYYIDIYEDSNGWVYKHYCMKTSSNTGYGSWPAGNYCVYREGGYCPSGFYEGHIRFESKDNHGDNEWNSPHPDGTWTKSEFTIEYCCRSDGYAGSAIELPTEHPFVLFRHSSSCQKVLGMSYYNQYFRVDTENTDDDSSADGYYPYVCGSGKHDGCHSSGEVHTNHLRDPEVHYCYYY